MSSNLIKKGYNLIVYDKVEEAIKNLEKLGAKGAGSSKEVAKECDLVFMIVPDSSHSMDVIFGKDGLIEELKKGSTIVDMSSISPFYSKEIGKKCEEAGINYVDAPVSGGEPKAITGELSFMVGAKENVFNDVKEYLECMGKNITLVGDIGSGTGTKLANQIIVNLNIAALSEAMIITKSLNIDPSKMLKAIGVEYVIIGHSERRQYFAETDETVNKKIKSALANGLKPIVCVGETLEQREAGQTEQIVTSQIEKAFKDIPASSLEQIIIAYEPIWAIGTGKTATKEDANTTIMQIRKKLSEIYGQNEADGVIIQYGGSVKPSNAKELFEMSDIDGGLVGGASLKADEFSKIVNYNK